MIGKMWLFIQFHRWNESEMISATTKTPMSDFTWRQSFCNKMLTKKKKPVYILYVISQWVTRPQSYSAGSGTAKLKIPEWWCFTQEHKKTLLLLSLRSFWERTIPFSLHQYNIHVCILGILNKTCMYLHFVNY